MKIALVTPSIMPINNKMAYGGVEAVVRDLAVCLKKKHEPTVIAPVGTEIDGVKVIETIESDGGWKNEARAFDTYKYLLSSFDVVHSHQHDGFCYQAKIHEKPDLPVVHTFHGLQTWQAIPNLGPHKHNLVALSKFHEVDCKVKYPGSEYKIASHGVDLDYFKYNADKDDFFLCMGLMAEHKGHLNAIEACKKAGVQLVVAGEDRFVSDMDYVNRVIVACAKSGFEYAGRVSHESKLHLLSRARALLLPFRIGEAYSLLAIEAMACGTPVICTGLGAIPEIVQHGTTGLVYYHNQQLVDCIKKIDKIDGKNCRALVKAKFSKEEMTRQYVDCYEKAVKGGW